jgi:hypothetical protein
MGEQSKARVSVMRVGQYTGECGVSCEHERGWRASVM